MFLSRSYYQSFWDLGLVKIGCRLGALIINELPFWLKFKTSAAAPYPEVAPQSGGCNKISRCIWLWTRLLSQFYISGARVTKFCLYGKVCGSIVGAIQRGIYMSLVS